jgi:hypothetical protein
MVKAIHSWKPISRRPIGRPKTRWVDDVRKDIQKIYRRLLPKIEEDGKSWLRRPKLYKRVAEPHKKKKKNSSRYYHNLCCLHAKYPLFWSDLNSLDILEKSPNIKFHENPSSGKRVFPGSQTDGREEITKLTVAFRNFANASKNSVTVSSSLCVLYYKSCR